MGRPLFLVTHSLLLLAAFRCGLSPRVVTSSLGPGAMVVVVVVLLCVPFCVVSVLDVHDTSNGTSLVIALLVLPATVLMLAALTKPSFPLISSSITAIFQETGGVSLCTNTTSPTLMACSFFPVAQ